MNKHCSALWTSNVSRGPFFVAAKDVIIMTNFRERSSHGKRNIAASKSRKPHCQRLSNADRGSSGLIGSAFPSSPPPFDACRSRHPKPATGTRYKATNQLTWETSGRGAGVEKGSRRRAANARRYFPLRWMPQPAGLSHADCLACLSGIFPCGSVQG